MLPAFYSKHKPLLSTSFGLYLAQNDQGISNGTCLWLGGQVLAHYLAQTHARFRPPASFVPRAIELGSGIGMTALVSPVRHSIYSIILTKHQAGA